MTSAILQDERKQIYSDGHSKRNKRRAASPVPGIQQISKGQKKQSNWSKDMRPTIKPSVMRRSLLQDGPQADICHCQSAPGKSQPGNSWRGLHLHGIKPLKDGNGERHDEQASRNQCIAGSSE